MSQKRVLSRFEGFADLCSLSALAEDTVLATLRERFLNAQTYTAISPLALVSLNPYASTPLNGDASLQDYVTEFHRTIMNDELRPPGELSEEPSETLGPHIFQTVLRAYFNMLRTKQDQVLMMSGPIGSGKTELKKLAIHALSETGSAYQERKANKLNAQISHAAFILESFGNAHIVPNHNASRFGNYTELQYDGQGHLKGMKSIEYYFERSRVSTPPLNGERNFHVFYYLISGAHGDERTHLQLSDAEAYRYLRAQVRRNGPSDHQRFEQLKEAFHILGVSNRLVAQICQLLALVLHIGNLTFSVDKSLNEGASVVDRDALSTAASFLGVETVALGELFSYKTVLLGKEVGTAFLDDGQAEKVRDDLARTLYSLLFSWLNEHINLKLCKASFDSFIAVLDLPGCQNSSGISGGTNSVDQFCFNFGSEMAQNWILRRIHIRSSEEAVKDSLPIARTPYFDNSECIKLLCEPGKGLIHVLDDHSQRRRSEQILLVTLAKRYDGHPNFASDPGSRQGANFTINHYCGPVTYSVEGLVERNINETSADILRLLRGTDGMGAAQGSNNPFVKALFSLQIGATQVHPPSDATVTGIQKAARPSRAPSAKGENDVPQSLPVIDTLSGAGKHNKANLGHDTHCVIGQHLTAIKSLLEALDHVQPWYIFALRPNDSQLPGQIEIRTLKAQLKSFGLAEMAQKLKLSSYEAMMTHREACERYCEEFEFRGIPVTNHLDMLRDLKRVMSLPNDAFSVGTSRVFLSHAMFRLLEDRLRHREFGEHGGAFQKWSLIDQNKSYSSGMSRSHPHRVSESPNTYEREVMSPGDEKVQPVGSATDSEGLDSHTIPDLDDPPSALRTEGHASTKSFWRDFEDKGEETEMPRETREEYRISSARRRWVILCALLTCMVPGFALRKIGGMKREDIRQAWREKLAINMIIWFICGCTIFVIAVLGPVICPTQHVYAASELASHSYKNQPKDAFVAIRGEVFDLTSFCPAHLAIIPVIPIKSVMQYSGLDATPLFPVQVNALCDGSSGPISNYVTFDSTNSTDVFAAYHDFRAYTNDSRPDWYAEQMIMLRYKYRMGFVGYTRKDIKSMAGAGRAVAIVDGIVYEMTNYIAQGGGGLKAPSNYNLTAAEVTSRQFMASEIVSLFTYNAGQDISHLIDGLSLNLGLDVVTGQKRCLRNLFIIGQVDTRDSPQCQFSSYVLLALSCVMVSIIGFKFLAALHFGTARAPENHDKFIICQVPCYTEGEESLRRTIDSVVRLRYDDKRKLLVVICDGNIKGLGNDKATPATVLEILGVDPKADPEPLSFHSLGEGAKQHNMGKIYAGLYECAGHVVPYLVVVKVGTPNEGPKPGNRGKRDSQMVLMHFLNKIHFNSPMAPLELEMYHQIKNVVGVNPSFYEYLFMIDADTTVDEWSLNHLVSAMMHDRKIIGVCGETSISNANQSIVTMAQVYEYFISHHLAKSFESLFGSITCLPGCFSMYRLRTPDTHKPLFISNQVIGDYSENRVDTLHLKNLLHLGEDRYLTTLVLKHFPSYKTKFVRDAHAQTVAPDSANILLSQRRRWINSTVHNLAELVFLEQLCGFCCFSMRFVVFVDLLSTVVAPVTVAYIGYLVFLIVHTGATIPTLSIIMLAAIYGLQALIFVFRLRWDMIAWMIFYILAIPVFSCFLPLYSFWKMDDFSWGSTRLVVSDNGKKTVIHDEGKFDPSAIPLKCWSDHENELWDHESDSFDARDFTRKSTQPFETISRIESPYMSDSHALTSDTSLLNHYLDPASHRRTSHLWIGQDIDGSPIGSSTNLLADTSPPLSDPFTSQIPTAGAANHINSRSLHARPVTQTRSSSYSTAGSLNVPFEPQQSPRSDPGLTYDHRAARTSSIHVDLETMLPVIREICLEADLDILTKKDVRRELERIYGIDLGDRREEINRAIITTLSNLR